MNIVAFEVKDYEMPYFIAKQDADTEIILYPQNLCEETLPLCKGADCVTTLGFSTFSPTVIKTLAEYGIKYIALRTVGYNNIGLAMAKKHNMRISNAHYDPYNVADFTVMLILMLLRKAKVSICRALVNDFSLDGMCGRELRSMTVGVIGAGNIGKRVIKNLSGFECKVLAYSPTLKQEDLPQNAIAVTLDELLEKSDIITLHTPLNENTLHILNKKAFDKMKKGVLIINTARGGLINTDDLIDALESEKIGGVALDTIESEDGIVHHDLRTQITDKRDLFYLKQFPNVIFTSHYAFFTEEASKSMVDSAIDSAKLFFAGMYNPYEIKF